MWGRVSVVVVALLVAVAAVPAAGASADPTPSWLRVAEMSIRPAAVAHGGTSASTAAAIAAATAPASQVHDPAGDVAGGFPQGDIIGAGFAQSSSNITLGVKVKTPANPKTDTAWAAGLVLIAVALDTNHDGVPEYIAVTFPDLNGGMSVALLKDTGDLACSGAGAFISGYGYTATFAKNCLPGGLSFQFQAAMSYTTNPDDAASPPTDIAPDNTFSPTFVTTQTASSSGYWMLGADGRVYPFGGAVGFAGLVPGAAAMTPRKDGKGYWVVNVFGQVFAYGSAGFHGGSPSLKPGETITTIASTPTGNGYWLFSSKGRAFAFGDAHSYGDLSGTPLNGAIIASTATPSGHGYYMIGKDGGIFAFGDAKFHGSTGNMRLNKPIVGMSPTRSGSGYWLVGSDGGVFAFNAPFRGSMGGTKLNKDVDGLVAYGNGYLMAAADGGVFDFSNRAFLGSLAEHPPSAPIIGLAAFGS